MQKESISWQVYEYEHKDKTPDWFWALGIIAVSITVASIIKGNYVSALFVVVAGIALGFYGNKKPDILSIEISEKGLKIQKFLYDFKTLKKFWVEEGLHENKLHVLSDRIIMPIITVPLGDQDPDDIRIFIQKYLTEEKLEETMAHKIMEKLGF